MKNLSFSLFNIVSIILILVIVVLIVLPFNLINMEQAQRIAKWKSEYEQLNYCFSLVNLHEGSIIPTEEEAGKLISEEYILERFKSYFNLAEIDLRQLKKYSYRKMNGGIVSKDSQFYFDKFIIDKDGTILSVKKNEHEIISEVQPLFFMFVDINGVEKPNRIGRDIFFLNIYRNNISALGNGRAQSKLKSNCSPIGTGLYCSEYYLLGGKF